MDTENLDTVEEFDPVDNEFDIEPEIPIDQETTVIQEVYGQISCDNCEESTFTALQDFFQHYVVDTVSGSFQVFQSMTYGEMAIFSVLTLWVLLFISKWIWEVLR